MEKQRETAPNLINKMQSQLARREIKSNLNKNSKTQSLERYVYIIGWHSVYKTRPISMPLITMCCQMNTEEEFGIVFFWHLMIMRPAANNHKLAN